MYIMKHTQARVRSLSLAQISIEAFTLSIHTEGMANGQPVSRQLYCQYSITNTRLQEIHMNVHFSSIA